MSRVKMRAVNAPAITSGRRSVHLFRHRLNTLSCHLQGSPFFVQNTVFTAEFPPDRIPIVWLLPVAGTGSQLSLGARIQFAARSPSPSCEADPHIAGSADRMFERDPYCASARFRQHTERHFLCDGDFLICTSRVIAGFIPLLPTLRRRNR